jgi:hypothetical protein
MDRVDEGEGRKAIALKAIRGVFIERDARVITDHDGKRIAKAASTCTVLRGDQAQSR